MARALEVVREWKRRLQAGDVEHMADVVDLDGYTEVCLGLTPWTVGFDVALTNYVKNMVRPWADMETREEDTVADDETVVTRLHTSATHVGEFLGIPASGRRIHWDAIAMVRVRDGRVVGQWAQPDLFAIYRQISDREIAAAPLAASLEGAPAWAYPSAPAEARSAIGTSASPGRLAGTSACCPKGRGEPSGWPRGR